MQKRTGRETVMVEDTRIIFRNFSGIEDDFNKEGNRNFSVVLPPDLGEDLLEEGWNVKILKPREDYEDETDTYHLNCTLGYKGRPPRVVMVTEQGKRVPLNEDMVDTLDHVNIKKVDIIFRPYHWSTHTGSGIKAYVKSLFVVIIEDPLEKKYRALEEADREFDGYDEPEEDD